MINGFGVDIDVDCIVTHTKTLPTLLPFNQYKIGRALHFLSRTYHPTLYQLVQYSRHPPTLALVKIRAEVMAANVGWHLNVEPVVFDTPSIMLSTSDAIFKMQEVLPQPWPLVSGCHLPFDVLEPNPALLRLPGGASHSWYAPLTQLPDNSGKVC